MKCSDVTRLVDAWLDGTLSEREARSVEGHAANCVACAKRLDAVSRLAPLPATLTPPPMLRAEVLAAVGRARRRRSWRRGAMMTGGVAAAALLAIALQPHRKQASDLPKGATILLASARAEPELAALARAEAELTAALADAPGDATLQHALDDLRRQRAELERIVRMATS